MAKPISSVLKHVLPASQQWKMVLFEQWPTLIGEVGQHVRIEKIYNSVLILGVTHPVWAQELLMLSEVLRRKINTLLQQERIEKIRFCVVNKSTSKKNNRLADISSATQERSFFSQASHGTLSLTQQKHLRGVKQEALRSALTKYFIRCRAFNKGT